ncbi:MAG TPA: TIR domain-containing protein [Anaerolineales bacterium]|nr:TIR domain-containing protein [Anaerolineales bacterium]
MDKNTLAISLKNISLFTDLPDDMIAQLVETVKEQHLAPGEILFNEGDEGTALYFIQHGEIEIYQPTGGKVYERLKAGDYFGEMALIEVEPRSASARALSEVTLFFLDRTAFMGLLEKNPQLGIKMTHRISSRLRMSMSTAESSEKEKKNDPTKSETKVFISYSRRDKPFVAKLNEALSQYQIDTWVDWENIPLTADWWNEIRLGIENADAFAFVISPDSLTSEVCGREIQTAVDNHKRLIPILHRDPQKGNPMHEKISSHNWIYMRDDAEMAANVPQMLAVVNTDLDFVKTHTRLLERALGWEREKKNNSFVLQGDELHQAERWLESAGKKQPQPTSLHIEFIQASRRAANQRQRNILTASLVGLGIAVVLAIVSFVFYLQANDAKDKAEIAKVTAQAAEVEALNQRDLASTAQVEAENQRNEAINAQATAVVAKNEAITQADIAATKQAEAEAAKAEAEAQKALAEEQARLAKAGDLAASGLTLVESNPPLAILLALESNNLSPDNKTAQEVFSLIPIYFPPLKEAFIDPYQSVENIAWSSTGKLASSSDTNIIIWNLGTYEPEQTFIGQGYITALAWAPDGRLATGDNMGQITLWNVETGESEPVEAVNDELAGITSLAWNPRGYLTYAMADSKNTIVVQDLSGLFPPTKIPNRAPVNAIAWNNTATPVMAAGLDDGSVALWIVSVSEAKATNVINYYDHQSGVISVAYAPDNSLATGSKDSTIAVRGAFGSLKAILHGHTDYVNAVAWSDDNQLASGSWDKTVILWDLENEVAQRVFRGHSSAVNALDWGPDGKLTSGADFIYVWDTAANNSLTTYPGHLDWTYSVQWTPQGQLLSAGGDGRVIFWDEATQAIEESVPNAYAGKLVAYSNTRVLSGAYLIDREEKKNYWFPGYGHIFSPDGSAVVGLTGSEMAMWPIAPLFETGDLVTNTLTVEEASNMQSVTWSPDGKTLATGQYDGTIILWDYNSGGPSVSIRATLPGHTGGISTMAWSPDGRLASVGGDNTIIVWDIAAQTQEKTFTANSEVPITGMSWSPTGELATVSGDNNIVIWDVDKGEKISVLGAPYRAGITSVAWSPDGTKLAFGGQSYNVYVYNTRFIQDPCTWLTRNMTYNEWTAYLPGEPYRATCPDRPVGTAFEDEKQAQVTALLNEAIEVLETGEIELGVQKFQEVEAQGFEIDAWSWNNLCWFGALYNQAEITNFACDRALELSPEDGDIRDSRGVSRALLGDFEGAIEDFEAFIAYAQEMVYPEDEIFMRQQWIEALQEGTNPFDEATLAMLRGE